MPGGFPDDYHSHWLDSLAYLGNARPLRGCLKNKVDGI